MSFAKSALKRGCQLIALIAVLPLWLLVAASARLTRSELTFQSAAQLLCIIPTPVGTYLRAAFYRLVLNNSHQDIGIGFLTLFSHRNTSLGKNVYIGAQCNIGSCNIGSDCLLGSGVHILSGKHQHHFADSDQPIRLQGGSIEKIIIGDNSWIGNQATVMANLGANTIVAAGAVVVDDAPGNCILAGNPARIIRKR